MSEIIATIQDIDERVIPVKAYWKPGAPVEQTPLRKVTTTDQKVYDCWKKGLSLEVGKTYRLDVEHKPNPKEPDGWYHNIKDAREMFTGAPPAAPVPQRAPSGPYPGAPVAPPVNRVMPRTVTPYPGTGEQPTVGQEVYPPLEEVAGEGLPPRVSAQPLNLPDILSLKCPCCNAINVYVVQAYHQ